MLLTNLTRKQSNDFYVEVVRTNNTEALRRLCREDLFFLLTVAFKRKDINNDWLYARCREVEASPDGHIDLWAREHYKSTIITYGKTIQDILNDPEETFGIFSHTRPIAKKFLSQIKTELETNSFLKGLFPDILYQDPQKESPRWSLDGGIIVKRMSNPKEATVEAYGLVDGQPTSVHFTTLIYDDVVTLDSISSPEVINKVTDAWSTSLNLSGRKDGRPPRIRFIGTRYHANDTYAEIIRRGSATPRYYYPTDLGKNDIDANGNPYLLSPEELKKKRRDFGPYTYSCQMLQNPQADKVMGFKLEWLESYHVLKNYENWNFYITVDPAGEKKKSSDYTVMVVIGLAPDNNYYLVDGLRDRLNLTQRADALIKFHRKWKPKGTGYEKYGKDSDIEHIKYAQEQEGYRFEITPLGGAMAKNDRIRRMVPIFETHRFFMPVRLLYNTVDGKVADLISIFLTNEYSDFPVSKHDDIFDCIARITDEALEAKFPTITDSIPIHIPRVEEKDYDPLERAVVKTSSNDYKAPSGGDWKSVMVRKA